MQQFRGTPKLVSTHTELDTATHVQTDHEPHKKGTNNVYQFLWNHGTFDHGHSLHGRSSEPSPSGRNKLVVRPKSLATVSGFKLADELSRRSKSNGDTTSENQLMLWVTCVILGIVGSAALGYIVKNQKDKKKAEVEKAQRVAQLNQLILWRQETLARQGFAGGPAAAQVIYDQRNEVP